MFKHDQDQTSTTYKERAFLVKEALKSLYLSGHLDNYDRNLLVPRMSCCQTQQAFSKLRENNLIAMRKLIELRGSK